MTRPRAADDFLVIRARMEELRRERAQTVPTEAAPRPPDAPRPYAVGSRVRLLSDPGHSPAMRPAIRIP